MKYVPHSVDAVARADNAPDTVEPNSLQLLQAEYPNRYLNYRPFPPKEEETSMWTFNRRIEKLRVLGIKPLILRHK